MRLPFAAEIRCKAPAPPTEHRPCLAAAANRSAVVRCASTHSTLGISACEHPVLAWNLPARRGQSDRDLTIDRGGESIHEHAFGTCVFDAQGITDCARTSATMMRCMRASPLATDASHPPPTKLAKRFVQRYPRWMPAGNGLPPALASRRIEHRQEFGQRSWSADEIAAIAIVIGPSACAKLVEEALAEETVLGVVDPPPNNWANGTICSARWESNPKVNTKFPDSRQLPRFPLPSHGN